MFEPVTSKVSFPELEQRILSFWKEKRIFERSVEQRKGGPQYVLYDGPPTANASPGIHHVLARVFKDLFPRYKTMKGYYAERKAGWDTHGLPVELEVENELGLKSKPEIEEFGIAEFNSRCRQNVLKYVQEWKELTDRIGFWIDMEHPYITFDNGYIETCWWIIKELWERGLVYQGYRVTPHCPRCVTSLSSHEVALGYAETDDPSVYIKFKVVPSLITEYEGQKRLYEPSGDKPTYLLAWTTTPWTLPGNTALAVAPEAEYVVVKKDDEYLILASACLKQVGLDDCEVVERLKGSDLATITGVNYKPLFNPHEFGVERMRLEVTDEDDVLGARRLKLQESEGRLFYKVITADFVSMEEGTGIVHVAPAFGEIDFEVLLHPDYCLDFVQPVDLQGDIIGNYPFAGLFVKDADPLILEDLDSRELLYRHETIRHTYPFCWRCESPLLYYAKPSWYIKTTARKDRLVSGNDEINWYPDYIKYGRFGDWLNNNVDWAFSRERYWGTPLPIWRCDGCGLEDCIGSVDELGGKPGIKGVEGLSDLHRPYIDGVIYDCPKCGTEMRRVPEVIDCWFDSGAMPFAQWHYPFENQDLFEERFPADYICEAVDQTRGWFYSLHAISILIKNQPCFKNVICLGHILDSTGDKMSKSKRNVVTPGEVLDASGADALRWYLYTSSPPGNVRRFSSQLVAEVVRKFMLTVWNTYSFFVTYANIDKFDPGDTASLRELAELDRWILSELNRLIDGVTSALDQYDPTGAGRLIEDFVQDLSNWYVRRSRRRFWKSENDADKLAAYTTLYRCLVTLVRLLAPFTPFIAEELYQNLVRSFDKSAPESVHLTSYPQADPSEVDEELSADTHLAMTVSSMGRSARAKAGLKVRQPLAKVLVRVRSKREKEGLDRMASQILEELNVKDLHVESLDTALGVSQFPPFPDEEIMQFISFPNITVEEAPNWTVVEEGGLVVMIDSDITQELADEGLARELVHRLQTMRKQAGFDIADYIETYYQGGDSIKRAMREFASYIKQETLSRTLTEASPPEGAFVKSHMLEGNEVTLAVKRTSN